MSDLPQPTSVHKLNPKEQHVCDSYLRAGGGMTMVQAYDLEFTGKGCAYRFFRRGVIRNYIADHQHAASQRTAVSIDRTLRETAAIAHSNIKDVYSSIGIDENGMIDLSEVPDHVTAAIDSVKIVTKLVTVKIPADPLDEDSVDTYEKQLKPFVEVKMQNKAIALDMIFRVLGGYKKDGSNPHVDDALGALVRAIGEQGLPRPGDIRPPVVINQ